MGLTSALNRSYASETRSGRNASQEALEIRLKIANDRTAFGNPRVRSFASDTAASSAEALDRLRQAFREGCFRVGCSRNFGEKTGWVAFIDPREHRITVALVPRQAIRHRQLDGGVGDHERQAAGLGDGLWG